MKCAALTVANNGYWGNILNVIGKSSSLSLFGVLPEKLKGVCDFVGNALTRTMVAGSKLKVLKAIIRSISVLVMDGLFGRQRPTKTLFHDVAVLQHKPTLASGDGRRNADISVAAFEMPRVGSSFKFSSSLRNLSSHLANLAAKLLGSSVHNSAPVYVLTPRSGGPALLAGVKSLLSRSGFPTIAVALAAAIFWIVAKPFAVKVNVGFHHGEAGPALLAGEVHRTLSRRRSSIIPFAGANAGNTAKSGFGLGWLNLENVLTNLASLLDGHSGVLSRWSIVR